MALQNNISGYQSLLNLDTVYTDDINALQVTTVNETITGVNPYSVLAVDVNDNIVGTNLTNGQVLIGSTGLGAVAATLTGTVHEVIVTNSAGAVTLSLPQAIDTTSSPSFANITDSGLTASELVATNATKQLESVAITNANGCNTTFSGSTLACTMTQNLTTTGQPSFANI